MAFAPLFDPTQQFMARSGAPLAGGLLYVYRNTSQSLATLKNVAGTTIANPVTLDADGRAAGGVFVSDASTYTLVVKDAFDATLWTIAAMSPLGGGGGGSDVTITPTVTSGTKIADYSIDGEAGELYAPNGGSGTVKRVGFVNTSGNIKHTITSDDISNGYCIERERICYSENIDVPYIAVILHCFDFWEKTIYTSIDVSIVYDHGGGSEYVSGLFSIDATALSENKFKDYALKSGISLDAGGYAYLQFKWNLNNTATIGDEPLIKCNAFVASEHLYQGLM